MALKNFDCHFKESIDAANEAIDKFLSKDEDRSIWSLYNFKILALNLVSNLIYCVLVEVWSTSMLIYYVINLYSFVDWRCSRAQSPSYTLQLEQDLFYVAAAAALLYYYNVT